MNKRGQIYLVAVILIGFILFALLSQGNYVRRVIIDDDFDTLSKNFDTESARFINENLDLDATNLGTKFASFSNTFSDYSRTQNPDFELLFLLRTSDTEVMFCNFMEGNIEVTTQSTSPDTCTEANGCFSVSACYDDPTTTQSCFGDACTETSYYNCDVTSSSNAGRIQDICKRLPVGRGGSVTITIDDVEYTVKAPSENKAELVVVTKEDKGEQRRVFLEEGFVKGKDKK